ncbi:hypothetical protein AWR36_007670 [Microbulbifer flavimaris]|uniref:Nucleotide modification associated domain-containing protein n=1 Tax=Microbulbifer flavimaris TaxID=1781068 RepID=A0ABX4I173_9GAMM|nr:MULTISPECIES: hypothetical protein [Microbulbifer]KUJ83701.1 hypothetical protein AVO43_07645 [Microbulbifer sp. ZGT114]PCO05871.1 hypothetical protein AWR36_007670 [Microbulbifer flavimaris]
MRLILSRKGFDSSAGGCPSPIFPDGTLYPLPIPDAKSRIQYDQIQHGGTDIGELVNDLTRGRYTGKQTAHLDPDMYPEALARSLEWRPLLGQTGAAQGHLRRQGVQIGDLFLFFGLFRPVECSLGHWRFVKNAAARHILWGWLAIGDIQQVDELSETSLPWARYHPHFQIGPDRANTLYLAADQFRLPRAKQFLPGAGIFPSVSPRLVLTAPDSSKPSLWRLPAYFFPFPDRTPLSYHNKCERWLPGARNRTRGFCQLQSAARGQEFVLDADQYPECRQWISGLIRQFGRATVGV